MADAFSVTASHQTKKGTIGATNAAVTMSNLDGLGTAGIGVEGTWSGILSFEGTVNETDWVLLFVYPIDNGVPTYTAATNGSWRANITGLKSIRARLSSYTSGSASVTIEATAHAGLIRSLSTLIGGTDGTVIGNVDDRVKVDAIVTVTPAPSTFGTIFRKNEISVTTKTKSDLANSTYTVPAGKTFVMTSFAANFDVMSPMYVRLEKQTGGAGAFESQYRITLKIHGQDQSAYTHHIPYGTVLGAAGDVFKITYESALAKGTLWAAYTGLEY